MTRPDIPAHVLERLPDWRDAGFFRLKGGLNNRTWRLDKGGRSAVLKFDADTRGAPFTTRRQEGRVQAMAAAAGLASPVLYADDDILLGEYVEGSVWTAGSFDDENLTRLAASLRKLHALPPTGRSFDAAGAAQHYVREIDGESEIAQTCLHIAMTTRASEHPVCCHNDLVAENIVSTPGIRFLDWEYACDNNPMFDLATVIEHHELNDTQAEQFLTAYVDAGSEWQEQLLEQRQLYRALLWLWLASRPGSTDSDLERVAERLTTNCS